MRKIRIFALSMLALFVFGCGVSNELRIDDFKFGNSKSGLDAEVPIFKVGDKVFLNYAIRGMKADKSGMASLKTKLSLSVYNGTVSTKKLSRIHTALESDAYVEFKVNSEITSYGPVKAFRFVFDKEDVGKGTLKFEIHDKIADKTLIKDFPFEVAP